jgi:hypothetical protein
VGVVDYGRLVKIDSYIRIMLTTTLAFDTGLIVFFTVGVVWGLR